MDKQEFRQYIRQAKKQHSSQELNTMSVRITELILQLPIVMQANTILAYASLNDEVSTTQLLQRLLQEGKTVLLPKVIDNESMEVRQYTSANDLQEGAFHIKESTGQSYDSIEMIDVAIIPGMAFTKNGCRMGRGKGYYDRFLSRLSPTTTKIGVCYPFQIQENIPTEPHDIRMDLVLTV